MNIVDKAFKYLNNREFKVDCKRLRKRLKKRNSHIAYKISTSNRNEQEKLLGFLS